MNERHAPVHTRAVTTYLRTMWACLFAVTSLTPVPARGENSPPEVIITSVQQVVGTSLITVTFDLDDADGDPVDVTLYYSVDEGATWLGPCATVWGDVGIDLEARSGMKATWDAGVDLPGVDLALFKMRVYADDGMRPSPPENFVYIAPGTFEMGSPTSEPGRNPYNQDNETQHTVTLTRGFYMSKYEVTEQWWAEVMGGASMSQLPKASVTWDMAVQFCNALSLREGLTPAYTILGTNGNATWNRNANGYRLPTEAEWEYACRAESPWAFANGPITVLDCGIDPNLNAMGWYCGNTNRAQVVGQKQPNAWGLYDMHGNVWEWVWDGYRADYQNLPGTDPVHDVGPGSDRVIRGGGWSLVAQVCRSAVRFNLLPTVTFSRFGFRPVRSAF
jgi:formylglycine-generating enzyme required for sulfatase activity